VDTADVTRADQVGGNDVGQPFEGLRHEMADTLHAIRRSTRCGPFALFSGGGLP
jgi:hypothetical protein